MAAPLWLFALRVPHGRCSSGYLRCFALGTAFPFALVGRDPHDYYQRSVALGLASRRRSRVPSLRNVSSAT